MRTLLANNAPSAKEAVDLFIYRIGRELGSLAAALGGLDAVVFTFGSGVSVWVVATDGNLSIARNKRQLLD